MASNSNIEILQRFQNPQNYRRHTYVTNDTLHQDLNVPYVRDEIRRPVSRYTDRMKEHSNILMKNEKSHEKRQD